MLFKGMELTPSLLNWEFVLLLCGLALLRTIWPRRYFAFLVGFGSAVLVGMASPKTFLAIAGTTLLYLYPLHRLIRASQDRTSSTAKEPSAPLIVPPPVFANAGEAEGATVATAVAVAPEISIGNVANADVSPRISYRTWNTVGVVGLVAILITFKVNREFTVPLLGGVWIHSQFLALVGFSYFLFRAVSFLNMTTILRIDDRSPLSILCYMLFPPTITSGPIQKYQEFRLQLNNPEPLSRKVLFAATYRITRGYFRKAVLAFTLFEVASGILKRPTLTVATSLVTLVLLYFFFYFDFAGYSDIAIGFGLLMGFRVPENFRKPFLATTVSEFWRNWHITLVDWFRDHVFIPLGGMQSSRRRAAGLAFLIMVLCGFWHGFVWAFVAWGVWHGLALFIEAMVGVKPVPPSRRHGVGYWSRVLLTNAIVAFGGIWFLPHTSMMKVFLGFTNW
jgi:alginate O-acetyltransferase complex protein AlgI